MKNNSLGMKTLMLLLTLGVLAYFGVQGLRYFADPLSTAMAYSYVVEDGLELTGYVVRQEQVLPDAGGGLLRVQRVEGERVSKGGTVALTYADQISLDRQEEIEQLTLQKERLEYIRDSALAQEASMKLDNEIMRELIAFRRTVEAQRLDLTEESAGTVKNLVLKRDYTYSDTAELEAKIGDVSEQIKALKAQVSGAVRRVTSPVSGLYSGVVDGYETLLTPELLEELTPSQLSALKPERVESSAVGKLVLGDSWYYTAVVPTQTAKQLEKVMDKQGITKLTLRFIKNVERDLPVELYHISDDENGRCVITFRGETYLPQLTMLRSQTAQIIYESIEGIRVPKEAIRAERLTVDSEGVETTVEALGVYCVVGMEARFKPVEILYSGEHFTLVVPAKELEDREAGKETIRLRSGDEVIISARDLYDGKVVG
jgi:hypothetical protein